MTAVAFVDAYLDGKNPTAVELFRRFEQLVESCGPSEAAPRSSIVYGSGSAYRRRVRRRSSARVERRSAPRGPAAGNVRRRWPRNPGHPHPGWGFRATRVPALTIPPGLAAYVTRARRV